MSTLVNHLVFQLTFNSAGFRTGVAAASAQADRLKGKMLTTGVAAQRMQLGLFAAGFAGAAALRGAVVEASAYESAVNRASLASGQGAALVGALGAQARQLSRDFAVLPSKAGSMSRAVNQMGLERLGGDTAALNQELSGAAFMFARIADVDGERYAKTLFRLSLLTNRNNEDIRNSISNAKEWAGAMLIAGRNSAAGEASVSKFLEKLVQAGLIINANEKELIALAATMSNIQETAPERATTSMIKLFTDEAIENAASFAKLLSMSTEQFEVMRRSQPITILKLMSEVFKEVADEVDRTGGVSRDVAESLSDIGINTQRLKRDLASITSSFDVYVDIMAKLGEEGAGALDLAEQWALVVTELSFKWDAFVAGLGRAGLTIVNFLRPAIDGLLSSLTKVANFVADNPMVAALVGVGMVGVTGKAAFRAGAFGLGAMTGAGGRGIISGGPLAMNAAYYTQQRGRAISRGGGDRPPGKLSRMRNNLLDAAAFMMLSGFEPVSNRLGPMVSNQRFRRGSGFGKTFPQHVRPGNKFGGNPRSMKFDSADVLGVPGSDLFDVRLAQKRASLAGAKGTASAAGLLSGSASGRIMDLLTLGLLMGNPFKSGMKGLKKLKGLPKLAKTGGGMFTGFGRKFVEGFAGRIKPGSLFGRIGATRGGAMIGRGLGMAIPGVGAAAILGMLAPLAGGLGNLFDKISKGTKVIRPAVELFETLFRIIEFGGNIVNFVFKSISNVAKRAWNAFKSSLVGRFVMRMWNAFGEKWDKMNQNFKELNENIEGSGGLFEIKVKTPAGSDQKARNERTNLPVNSRTMGARGSSTTYIYG